MKRGDEEAVRRLVRDELRRQVEYKDPRTPEQKAAYHERWLKHRGEANEGR